jgi:phosphatidylserine decarboxylase
MDEFDPSDINDYPSFQEFFIRKHAVNSRPIADQSDGVLPILD